MADHTETFRGLASESPYPHRVIRVGLGVMLFGSLAALHGGTADATTPTAVADCTACASVSDLQSAANSLFYSGGGPPGTIVYMISLNEPIAMYFVKECPNGQLYPCTSTIAPQYFNSDPVQENNSAAALDNLSHSRAAMLAPVVTPPDITYSETDEVIVAYIQQTITYANQFGTSLWHVLAGFPQVAWYLMTDNQTGQTQKIWVGDNITVNYPGGYSEKWKFLGVHAGSIQWQRVPNTLMQNGVPVTPPSNAPASGGGGATGSNTYNPPGSIASYPNGQLCYGISSVSVQNTDGTWLTSYGTFTYPCMG